eukprot:12279961-Alexandrium_andersonii.AAC.1
MLLRLATAECANVYARCHAKSIAPADGGSCGPPGNPAPTDGGWDGFPDGPIRRLVPATASWVKEGTDQRGSSEDSETENSWIPLLCNALDVVLLQEGHALYHSGDYADRPPPCGPWVQGEHRPRIPEIPFPENLFVARSVRRQDIVHDPEAQAALRKEWGMLLSLIHI